MKAKKYIFLQCKYINCLGIDEIALSNMYICPRRVNWFDARTLALSDHTLRASVGTKKLWYTISCFPAWNYQLRFNSRNAHQQYACSVFTITLELSYVEREKERYRATYMRGRERTKWTMLSLMPSSLWSWIIVFISLVFMLFLFDDVCFLADETFKYCFRKHENGNLINVLTTFMSLLSVLRSQIYFYLEFKNVRTSSATCQNFGMVLTKSLGSTLLICILIKASFLIRNKVKIKAFGKSKHMVKQLINKKCDFINSW